MLFSSSIVLGIAALVAIASFGVNLQTTVDEQARTLLGADLVVNAREPLNGKSDRAIETLGGIQSREVSFSTMVYFPRSEGSRLVQVRGIGDGFPYYGQFETQPPGAGDTFRAQGGALIEESLAIQYSAKVGDPVKVGELTMPISGLLQKIPGESIVFSTIAPRVYVPLALIPQTKLVKAESLARFKVFIKFPATTNVEQVVKLRKEEFRELRLQMETVADRKKDLGRAMENLQTFLSLGGLIALLLGGVGVASAIHVHVRQRIPSIAILRCLGASAKQTTMIYATQGMGLGAVGSLGGALLGLAVQWLLPRVLADFLPFKIEVAVVWSSVFFAAFAGFTICVLFALLPILPLRRVSPLSVLRASDSVDTRRDASRWVIFSLLGLALAGFAITHAPNWRQGTSIFGGIVAAFLVLAAVAQGVIITTRRLSGRRWPYVWRLGIASLHRPNNRTLLLTLSLGLGTFLILTLFLLQQTLLHELLPAARHNQPNTVMFDIQNEQRVGVEDLLRRNGMAPMQNAPVVTMRLSTVKGSRVEELLKQHQGGVPPWVLRREYRSTYRDALVDSEEGVGGRWPQKEEKGVIPISVEEGIAKDLRVRIGDAMTFDVQGVEISTKVAHLRKVDWRRMAPNFFMVFPEGTLEAAPAFHIMTTKAPSAEIGAKLQREMVKLYPNVSIIDMSLVLRTVDSIVSKVSFAVRFMAYFTLGTGLLVLMATVLTGRYQRIQESILLRTLGASRAQVLKVLVVEYFLLGLCASATGVGLALASAWSLARFAFDLSFTPPILPTSAAVIIVCSLTVATGLMMSRGILKRPPLEILRGE